MAIPAKSSSPRKKAPPANQALPVAQPSVRSGPAIKSVSASKAKAHLLALLTDVNVKHESVIITRRGQPIARLVPIEAPAQRDIFGYMKGTFSITGDILSPEPDPWEAMS